MQRAASPALSSPTSSSEGHSDDDYEDDEEASFSTTQEDEVRPPSLSPSLPHLLLRRPQRRRL